MAAAEIRSSSDQKKVILAVGLGVVALIALWWTLFGFGGSSKPRTRNNASTAIASPAPDQSKNPKAAPSPVINLAEIGPVDYRISFPLVTEPRRNIFAFYEPPPTPSPAPPTPTPPPPPPILLAGISPSNVYARTDD